MRKQLVAAVSVAVTGLLVLATTVAADRGASAAAEPPPATTTGGMVLQSSPGVATTGEIAAVTCTGNDAPMAKRLATNIQNALQPKPTGIGVTVFDRRTNTVCNSNAGGLFYTASIVKSTIVGALLRRAQEEGRELTQKEKDLSYAAITRSDNDATTTLRNQLTNAGIQHFMDLAGMDNTQTATSWGSYRTTSEDQVTLLKVLTSDNTVLTADRRAYLLDLMAQVVADQRWGTPAGAPAGVTVHVKNGWVPSSGWINSIGSFDGTVNGVRQDYMMAVLTGNSFSIAEGSGRIEPIARAAHRAFNPGLHAYPTLRNGSTGDQVSTLQYLLNHHRNAGLVVDGDFGSATEAAVKGFQSANGLDADGIVGPLTWGKLATVGVKAGDTGDAVRAAQAQLVSWGHAVTVSGTFDAASEAALKKFQTAQRLTADGVVSEATWKALVT